MRQVKIHGGYMFRRGFQCRKEHMDQLYFDCFLSMEKPYKINADDVDRLISWLKQWKTKGTSSHESRVRIRANAHSIIRETGNLV